MSSHKLSKKRQQSWTVLSCSMELIWLKQRPQIPLRWRCQSPELALCFQNGKCNHSTMKTRVTANTFRMANQHSKCFDLLLGGNTCTRKLIFIPPSHSYVWTIKPKMHHLNDTIWHIYATALRVTNVNQHPFLKVFPLQHKPTCYQQTAKRKHDAWDWPVKISKSKKLSDFNKSRVV